MVGKRQEETKNFEVHTQQPDSQTASQAASQPAGQAGHPPVVCLEDWEPPTHNDAKKLLIDPKNPRPLAFRATTALQPWLSGNRCLTHVSCPHVLHTYAFTVVNFSRHPSPQHRFRSCTRE